MKKIFTTICFSILFLNFGLTQTVFWSEDFETDGNGTRYTPEVEVLPSEAGASCNDHFARNLSTDGCAGDLINTTLGDYTGLSGNYLWVGEDHDDGDVGGSGNYELFITFDDIPSIAGKSNLAFQGLFATGALSVFDHGHPTIAPTNPDFIIVEYQIDGGGYQPVLEFHPEFIGNGFFNTPLAQDTDGDQTGDGTQLNNGLQEFTGVISGTGNTLDLRLRISANSAGEETAVDFFQLFEDFVLPVNLISFSGVVEDDYAVLKWQTGSELNNSGFEIQKSKDSKDWESIEFIEGRGTTVENNSYQYNDTTPFEGWNYYRLKQIDHDGKHEYSHTVSLLLNNPTNILIFPNPSTNNFNIQINDLKYGDINLKIFNSIGEEVHVSEFSGVTGNWSKKIQIKESGIFQVVINIGNMVYHKTILSIAP